jgi:hypothetical protein
MPVWMEKLLLIGVLVLGALAIHSIKEPFQVTVQTESCDYINSERDWFKDKLAAVRQLAQDLSGGIYATMNIKDENMKYQYDNWEGNLSLTTQKAGSCTTSNTSPECILLASADSNIAKYAQLSGPDLLEIARYKLLELDTTLKNELSRLDKTADVIGCPQTTSSQYTKTFNSSRDIAYISTEALRDKLRELSPYYIDTALLNVLLTYLIDDPRFLTRVNTIPAYTGYIKENINTYWNITRALGTTSGDVTNYVNGAFTTTQRSALSNYNYNISSNSNFSLACGIRGPDAGLMMRSNLPNGAMKYTWLSDNSSIINTDVQNFAFGTN